MIKFKKADYVTISKDAIDKLIKAPVYALKVYLYGCIHDSAEMQKIMSELEMSKNDFLDAIEYLQKGGFIGIDVENETTFTYTSAEPEASNYGPVYPDADFNRLLQSLFSDRVLSDREYRAFYECTEIFGLPKNVVLMLAEYCIANHKRGNRLPSYYITEKAREWAKEGIDNVEAASAKLNNDREIEEGTKKLLSLMGIKYRQPSVAEKELYKKWLREWLFEPDAIVTALNQTTSTSSPSMKYLDGILKSLYEKDISTKQQTENYFAESEVINENAKKLLRALGSAERNITEATRDLIKKYIADGFRMDMLIYCAKKASASGYHSTDSLERALKFYKDKGIFDATLAKAFDSGKAKSDSLIKEVYDLMGISSPVANLAKIYEKAVNEYGFSHEMLLYGAKIAAKYDKPLQVFSGILKRWNETGIKTMEQLIKADEAYRNAHTNAENITRSYTQAEEDERMKRAVMSMENINDDF